MDDESPKLVTDVTYHGLTHTCTDPRCHVPDYVATLIELEMEADD
jgi:hypothetical protein